LIVSVNRLKSATVSSSLVVVITIFAAPSGASPRGSDDRGGKKCGRPYNPNRWLPAAEWSGEAVQELGGKEDAAKSNQNLQSVFPICGAGTTGVPVLTLTAISSALW
jgi:hypothetical protein